MKKLLLLKSLLLLCALIVGSSAWADPITIYSETFGDNGNNNTVYASYSGYSATTAMFTGSGTVASHYTGSGKVGKNSVSVSDYDGASGKSAAWYAASSGNNTTEVLIISGINISGYESLNLSFGMNMTNGASNTNTTTVSYKIDNGEFQALSFTHPTSSGWSVKNGSISGTGSSLTIKFTMTTTGGFTTRYDDIKVTGVATGGGSSLTTSDLALTGAPIALNFDLYNNSSNQLINYTTSSTGAVTVSSSPYISASVDSENKRITITPTAVTPSAQTITVNQAADATYAAGSATFTVTVANSAPVINASNVNIEATATSGIIPYSISNPEGGASLTASETEDWISDVTVDSENSRVTFTTTTNTSYIHRTGTITLTYGDDLATKDITVNQSTATPSGSKHEWDLSTNSYSSANALAVTWTSSYATMTNSKGSGNDANNYLPTAQSSSRFYANNNLAITPSSGYKINGVVFTAKTEDYASTLGNSTWSNATAYVSNTKVTVIPTNGNNVISATIGGTCGFTKVEVYYELLPIPSITAASTSIAATTAETDGTISITYNNITSVVAEVLFYDSDGTTPKTYSWLDAEIDGENNLYYDIDENTGSARNAYMKVHAYDDELNDVYSPLITVTQAGIDYAPLPFNWAGGTSSALNALTGVTTNGLGSDYNESNAPYRVKMDNQGDYIQVKTNTQPGKVSIGIKMIGGSTTSKIKIQESADGNSFTDVEELTISGSQNDIVNLAMTSSFATSTRYVRIIKSLHANGGNIGVGPINIAQANEPAIPVVSGETVTLTTSANMAGWRAFYDASYSYSVDGNTKVYVADADPSENVITLKKIDGIPANVPVILHTSSSADSYKMTLTKKTVSPYSYGGTNKLIWTSDVVSEKYRLGFGASGVGFYPYSGTPASGAVILNISSAAGARELTIGFEDEATGVADVRGKMADGRSDIYNLNGQKVLNPTKGLYIMNGKKVIIK